MQEIKSNFQILREKKLRYKDRYEIKSMPKKDLFHPEYQKPASDAYRENYDDIFRKKESKQ